MQPVVQGKWLGRSREPVLHLALLLLLVDEALVLAKTDSLLVRPLRESVGRILLIIGDGSLLEAEKKRLRNNGGLCGRGSFVGPVLLAFFKPCVMKP